MWLSTHSIPQTIVDADGFLATNLKWVGVSDPPTSIASRASDNVVFVVGLVLIVIGGFALISWAVERWRFMRARRATTTLTLEQTLKNNNDASLQPSTGVSFDSSERMILDVEISNVSGFDRGVHFEGGGIVDGVRIRDVKGKSNDSGRTG